MRRDVGVGEESRPAEVTHAAVGHRGTYYPRYNQRKVPDILLCTNHRVQCRRAAVGNYDTQVRHIDPRDAKLHVHKRPGMQQYAGG